MIQPTLQLNDKQIAFFHENGYLVVEAITTAVEIALIKKVYDRIFAARAGREEGNQFDLAGSDEEGQEAALPQILKPEQYAPELQETLYKANATRIAQQLLGTEQLGTGSHAILKPPQTGAATANPSGRSLLEPARGTQRPKHLDAAPRHNGRDGLHAVYPWQPSA